MLERLELSNFAIADDLSVEFSTGLNVLTGETGAGKSILIDALGLLIGGRAESSWIRSGADKALIQGFFQHDVSASRRLTQAGRSLARLEGEVVTAAELSEQLGKLVTIHGQHASQVLMNPREQRAILDRLLPKKPQKTLELYRKVYATEQATTKKLEALREAVRERARRIDILSFQVDEIDAAQLNPNELVTLKEELETQRYSERILNHSNMSLSLLSEAEINSVSLLNDAQRDLAAAGRFSKPLADLAIELKDAATSVEAISQEIARFVTDFEVDAAYLESLENRLVSIEALQRKYGDTVEAILAYRHEAYAELESLQHADEDMLGLEKQQQALRDQLRNLAEALSHARQAEAKTLAKKVSKELKPLGMENAVFEVAISDLSDFGPFGKDKISFLFSANLGEAPSALSNVASGGELSRVMLGLNVVTGSDVPILAFDEVDAGIGGKTARAVGKLLQQLAHKHQVLVVTHLPQVAAFANAHFFVEKQEQNGRTVTRVKKLERDEREHELARMLSGAATNASLANASELLAESQALVKP